MFKRLASAWHELTGRADAQRRELAALRAEHVALREQIANSEGRRAGAIAARNHWDASLPLSELEALEAARRQRQNDGAESMSKPLSEYV